MFEKLLEKIAKVLNTTSIPYMVVGGQAVLLYGRPRLTRDIDITLGVNVDRLPDMVNAVATMDLNIIPEDYKTFVERTFVLPVKDEKSGIRVDFIFSFTPYEQQALQRVNKVKIKGALVNFASAEDVIIHKVFSGRPIDLEDVRSIMIKNPDFDVQYIRDWLGEFDKSFEGKGFLCCFEEVLKDRHRGN
jgi:predicted nucleotidyltransferase